MSFFTNRLLNFNRNSLLSLATSLNSLSISSKTKQFPIAAAINRLNSSLESNVEPKKDLQKSTSPNNTEVFKKVNNLIANNSEGRLFAVIQVLGKQYKITAGDIIIVEGYWPPTIGDRIRLDKVLLVGSRDFTLIGRPILQNNLIDVQATIIEKTLSHTKTNFRKHRRKQYMRINFYRSQHTMIRINSIEIKGKVNESGNNENRLTLF